MSDDDQEPDAAVEAFEQIRGEMALMRRAVERLAAERAEVPQIPDYSETLGEMAKSLNETMQRVAVLAQVAKDNVAPRHVADRIVAAGAHARDEDQRTIAEARGALERATAQLAGVVASARRDDEQNRWLAFAAIGGAALGMLLWAAFAGVVARAAPESWLWPERMAVRTLRLKPWAASRRLAAVSRPEQWNAMIRGGLLMQDNHRAVERCRKAADRTREVVSCAIRIEPERK